MRCKKNWGRMLSHLVKAQGLIIKFGQPKATNPLRMFAMWNDWNSWSVIQVVVVLHYCLMNCFSALVTFIQTRNTSSTSIFSCVLSWSILIIAGRARAKDELSDGFSTTAQTDITTQILHSCNQDYYCRAESCIATAVPFTRRDAAVVGKQHLNLLCIITD